MQEPLDNLSPDAQRVHANLMEDPDSTRPLEVIAADVGFTEGETANALRELQAAHRAAESFGGWSVVVG